MGRLCGARWSRSLYLRLCSAGSGSLRRSLNGSRPRGLSLHGDGSLRNVLLTLTGYVLLCTHLRRRLCRSLCALLSCLRCGAVRLCGYCPRSLTLHRLSLHGHGSLGRVLNILRRALCYAGLSGMVHRRLPADLSAGACSVVLVVHDINVFAVAKVSFR